MQIGTVNSEEPGRTKIIKHIISSPRCAGQNCESACALGGGGSLPLPSESVSQLLRAASPEEPGRWSSSFGRSGRKRKFPIPATTNLSPLMVVGPDAAAMERLSNTCNVFHAASPPLNGCRLAQTRSQCVLSPLALPTSLLLTDT